MMIEKLKGSIAKAITAMGMAAPENIEVAPPKDASHGDLATPVAMSLAKALRKNPRAVAEDIIKNLPDKESLSKIEIAGPGFINFTFSPDYLCAMLKNLLQSGPAAMRSDIGHGRKIQIEFVSANPTGPLHLGHGRGAAFGAALANLLKASGFNVTREYYINDAGRQVLLLGESVFARYKELHNITYPFPEEGYRGDYVMDIARTLNAEIGPKFKNDEFKGGTFRYFMDSSLKMMLDLIKADLSAFGVEFDIWQSERELFNSGAVQHSIDYLRRKDLMYDSDGAVWFRATAFKDEKDRVVVKADSAPTYFASDIAYHLKKIETGYDELINIWGADHHGYIPRLEAVIDALGYDRKKLRVLLVQMVSLLRAGVPVQMSKRSGEFVTLRELVDEVGADITKFIFLTRRQDSHLAFDIEAAKKSSSENPVFYVQYANARINSIFAKAKSEGHDTENLGLADLSRLDSPEESALIKKLLMYPLIFLQAAHAREPHRITFYLQELAGMYHPYYNTHRVLVDNPALSRARLALASAVKSVILDGLAVLGLTAPEKM